MTPTPAPARRLRGGWLTALLVLGGLLLWEALARTGTISAFYFPAPSRIAQTLGEMAASGQLLEQVR
ncbi:MAG: ABC transporter permease, partial [Gaiellaceae bacterium]